MLNQIVAAVISAASQWRVAFNSSIQEGHGKEIKNKDGELTEGFRVAGSSETESDLLDKASATLFSQPCLYSTTNK